MDTSTANVDEMVRVEFRVLGALEHGETAAPTALGGRRQKAVLAMLLRTPNSVVSDDAIIDGVWGDDLPGSVKQSLHTYISNLRALLGGRIERLAHGYLLAIEPESVDAVRFERMTTDGRAGLSANPERASAKLREALALWRGRPYADLLDVPGLQGEITRLENLRLLAVESRIDADLAAGRHSEIVAEIAALATEYPLKESLRARHMIALYRDGRQAEALRAYQQTRAFLGEELGVEPSPELRKLEERILQHDPALVLRADTHTETVAFLFTDVDDSTSLRETSPDAMRDGLAVHDEIIGTALAEAGGRIFKHTGDGVLAAFADPNDARAAAVAAQRRLRSAEWGPLGALEVKMAIDVGEVEARGGDYFGPVVNRCARLVAAAHGGQIVLSASANQQLQRELGVQTRSLGEHRFPGLGSPQHVFQLIVDDLPSEFPPLDPDRPHDGARHFGDAIRGYELREEIASGRFAVVYRAYQPAMGREVAVKAVRAEFANHPAFVRGFEAEARLVAKLSHPHIVPLFDFWRDNEGAYLVMPLLAGRSLAQVDGTLPVERVAEIVRQAGSALAYAHRQGVIHRDVKPANLLLDGEGNVYISDFGIALHSVEAAIATPAQGHPATEDETGAPVGESLDVSGLAAVAAKLLTGRLPPAADLGSLPERLRDLIESGLAPRPADRHPTIEAFVVDFLAAAGGPEPAQPEPREISRNPFKGLAAFDEADGRDFFGRTSEIAELVGLVERHRMVTVVGPSGSGKSSLVKAGLVPALRTEHPDEFVFVKCVPGAHPFDELATAIGAISTRSLGSIAEELRSDHHGLLRLTKQIATELGCEIVMIVDQFEELYSLVGDAATREAFVESLLEAGQDPHSRVRIVTTIRADFFDQPLIDGRLGNVVADAHLTLAVPNEDALTEAIVGPAALVGLGLEDGIASRIVGDVRQEPGALPLMQFVLTDLVDHAEGARITGAAYVALGGAAGALANRATAVYESLESGERVIAREIFLRMVTVSHDADDVRRRVRRAELEALGMDPGSLDLVLSAFTEARLLTLDRDPITRGPTVEVAHEALIREWDVLGAWIEDKREALMVRRRLTEMMRDWSEAGRTDDLLPSGTRLAQFEDWIAAGEAASADERAFVSAAVARREAAIEQRRRRRARTVAAFALAAAIASVLAVFASLQWRAADVEATRSHARELIAVADSVTERNPELALLVALEGVDEYDAIGQQIPVAAQQVLHRAIARHRIVERIPGEGRFVTAKPDGSALATSSEDGGYAVWDLRGEEPTLSASFAPPDGMSALTAWWEDGPHLHALIEDAEERWWLAGVTPEGVWREDDTWISVPDDFAIADLAPDGTRFVYLAGDEVTLVDTTDGRVIASTGGDDLPTGRSPAGGVHLGPSGHLYFASEGEESGFDVWRADARTGGTISLVTSTEFVPEDLSESPDGAALYVSGDAAAVTIDLETGDVLWQDPVGLGFPYWLPDGTMVGWNDGFTVIDAGAGEVIRSLLPSPGETDYAHIAGTALMASSGAEGVALIDVGADHVAEVGPPIGVGRVAFDLVMDETSGLLSINHAPDSVYTVAAVSSGETIVEAADLPEDLPHHIPYFSRGGSLAAALGESGVSELRRVRDGTVLHSAPAGFRIIGMNEEGSLVVETDYVDPTPGRTRLVRTGDATTLFELDADTAFRAVFSPDGDHITVSRDMLLQQTIRVFDASDGSLVSEIDEAGGFWHQLTPDGNILILGGADGAVRIYDFEQITSGVEPAEALLTPIAAHSSYIYRVVVSPDGTMLLTAAFGEPARLWDLESATLTGEFGTEAVVTGVGFHTSEPWVFIGEFGTVTAYTYDPDELVRVARDRVTRTLSEDECSLYLLRPCETG